MPPGLLRSVGRDNASPSMDERDNPFTVLWKLRQPVPERLQLELKVPKRNQS